MKITLCGSARFEEYFKFWNEMLSLVGHTVYTLSVYPSQKESGKDWYDEAEKEVLDMVHMNKISNSDAIFVINPFAYIGESTLNEVDFAQDSGKIIFCLESWGKGNGVGGGHYKHVQELKKWFSIDRDYVSPIKTSDFFMPWSPKLLGYGASEVRSKIFTCEKLFELSLYDKAGVEVPLEKL